MSSIWQLGLCLLLAFGFALPLIGQETTPAAAEDGQSEDEKTIRIWVGSFEEYEEEGIPYGCGSYLLPVDTALSRTGDTSEDLRVALEALFAPELNHAEAETEDWLKGLGLSVEEITLDEGEAIVTLAGTLLGIGSCGDAIMEGQILQTIFQFEDIERVRVSDGVTNLWEIIDLTDWYSEAYRNNYVYQRSDAKVETIQFWVGSFENYEEKGIPYGCGSYLLPVDTDVTRSRNPHTNLSIALEALFNPDLDHPEAETEAWLKGLGLSVEEITLEQGEAVVTLSGPLLGIGSCGDAIMEGQILQTVFQFDAIERVKISDGETNLWEIIDQSDKLSDEERQNYVYERSENGP